MHSDSISSVATSQNRVLTHEHAEMVHFVAVCSCPCILVHVSVHLENPPLVALVLLVLLKPRRRLPSRRRSEPEKLAEVREPTSSIPMVGDESPHCPKCGGTLLEGGSLPI